MQPRTEEIFEVFHERAPLGLWTDTSKQRSTDIFMEILRLKVFMVWMTGGIYLRGGLTGALRALFLEVLANLGKWAY